MHGWRKCVARSVSIRDKIRSMIDPGLDGKTVLVTGGAMNIGAGISRAADTAVFLASHQARWITGQIIQVAGGHWL